MNTSRRFVVVLSLLFSRHGAAGRARGRARLGAEKLERLLNQFPKSDANKVGKLTVKEAKAPACNSMTLPQISPSSWPDSREKSLTV